MQAYLDLFVIVILFLQLTPTNSQAATRRLTGGLVLPSGPLRNPNQGRRNPFGSRRRPLAGSSKATISEERINELTNTFKTNVERLKGHEQLDLIFVIDESSSVGLVNFNDEIKFVSRFVSGIAVDMNHTRVAVVTYSDNVTSWVNQVSMGEIHAHKCSLLAQDLPSITYVGGGTFTRGGLTRAEIILENARLKSKKVVFLITDGYHTAGDPRPLASRLKREGVEIFTFGIKDGDVITLTEMASTPKESHRLILNSFKEFDMVARRALHSDLESGNFIIDHDSHCDKYCTETSCCHGIADCRCGTSTGRYECVCKPGYYGSGLTDDGCLPCPEGTYKPEAVPGGVKSCLPCPDTRMTSSEASTSLDQCLCTEGFNKENNVCEPIRCEGIFPPDNGRFLACDGGYKQTCTTSCDHGYDLQGTETIICGADGYWSALNEEELEMSYCQVRYCSPLSLPEHGTMSCTSEDNSYKTVCTFECIEGFSLQGSESRLCEADRHWTGREAYCKEITCPAIPEIQHGMFSGDCDHETKSKYGDECSFYCLDKGYDLVVPQTVTCAENGRWFPNIINEDLVICNDTLPPTISCPPDVTATTNIRKPYSDVTWQLPLAEDNSGEVSVTPNWTFPVSVRIGVHSLTYVATDSSGLSTECQFTVTVRDLEPPMIDNCRGPQPFVINPGDTEVRHAKWKEPTFSDNSGKVTIMSSQTFGTFPLGVTKVEYLATDEAENERKCVIDIIVQDNTCPRLENPRHGYVECQLRREATQCAMHCDSERYGFAMPFGVEYDNPTFTCDEELSEWMPTSKIPMDCSRQKYSSRILKDYQVIYAMETMTHCNDSVFIESVRQLFLEIYTDRVAKWCATSTHPWLRCTLVDVIVKCIQIEDKTKVEADDYEGGDDSYYYNYYGSFGDGNEDRRRKRSTGNNPRLHEDHIRKLRRSKREADYSEAYSEDDYASEDYPYGDDVNGYGADNPVENEGGEAIPLDTLFEAESAPSESDYGGERVPDYEDENNYDVTSAIEEVMSDIVPVNVLDKIEKIPSLSRLEVTLTIRGDVTLEGRTIEDDRMRHGRMVEFIRNLDTVTEFENKARTLSINVINTTISEYLTYQDGTYAATQDELLCPIGTIQKSRAFCVNCPVGTYYDVISADCISCPIGFYQDHEAQLSCQPCPTRTMTKGIHSRDVADCKDLCQPGFFSEFGIEVCKSCPKDTFVDFYGATSCGKCPTGTGTVGRASNSADDCGELCKPGYVSIDGFTPCRLCPVGSFQNEMGKTFCNVCPGNEGLNMDNFVPCEEGEMDDEALLEALYYNECFAKPCKNSASCSGHGTTFTCTCQPGYSGDVCEIDIDECSLHICAEGSTCIDEINGFSCECAPGYEGEYCRIETDECQSSPCNNGATCVDLLNEFSCECNSGFIGDLCEVDIDECASNPCHHNGTCVDRVASFHCNCSEGFEGVMCQTNIDDCASDPCLNGATCVDGINDFECVCKPGYAGDYCGENINECSSNPCVNGECLDLINSYKCLCPPTYIGQHCEEVGDPYFDLYFGKPNTYHHVKLDYALGNMTEVTVSFYLRSNDTETYGTPFSYAVGDGIEADTLTLTDLTALTLYVNGEFAVSDSRPINDGRWYLVTIVWTSEGGNWYIYLDGLLEDSGEGLATGQTIPGGGVLVIGQEQDSLGGGFSASQEFLGTISHFNIHDRAFTPNDVILLWRNCANHVGNVRAWPDIGDGIIGNIERRPTEFCRPCPTIESDEGTVVEHTNDYTIEVRCNLGHELAYKTRKIIKVFTFRCGSDSVWKARGVNVDADLIKCLKVSCPSPKEIHLGSVSSTGTKYGDVSTYSCDSGYEIIGEAIRTCEAKKRWSGRVPSCGDINECDYEDSCHRKASCTNSIGSYSCACVYGWKGDGHSCREINCGGAGSLQFGSIQGNNFKLGGIVRYSCDYGYRLEGTDERTCLEDDTWSGEMPVCVKVECAEPDDVRHASKRPENVTRSYKSQITYRCHPGHYMIGNATRECGPDSQWTGVLPSCERVSCSDPPIVANAITIKDGGIKYQDIVHYVCEQDYIQLGDSELTCNASKIWEAETGKHPVCEHPTCGKPPPIINGEYEILQVGESTVTGATYTYATQVQYSCSTGYNIAGESILNCIEDGAWDRRTPRCDIVSCGPPPVVKNADREYNDVLYNDLANYICRQGYIMDGVAALTCLASGKWTDENQVNPTCNPRSCGEPDIVVHSQMSLSGADGYVYKAVVIFECDLGYRPTGIDTISCNTEGSWVPEQNFQCHLVTCSVPHFPEHGSTSRLDPFFAFTYEYNNTIMYSCDAGFYPEGVLESRCTEHGTWSYSPPVCLPVACPLPDDVANSTFVIADGVYGEGAVYGSSIQYTCDSGYQLSSGDSIRDCSTTTMWTGVAPICSRVECGSFPELEFSTATYNLYDVNTDATTLYYLDEIEYVCDVGFFMVGKSIVQCTSEAVFSQLPSCQPVSCGTPPAVLYSTLTVNDVYGENVYQSSATYICENDFRMEGNPTSVCNQFGIWENDDPTICEPIICIEPDLVSNAIQFVSSSIDDVAHPEIYKTGKYQPRSAAITACEKGFEIQEAVAYLKSARSVSDEELARGITEESIGNLNNLNQARVKKILAKLLDESPQPMALKSAGSELVVQSVPATLFIQQCSETVGWLKSAPKCKPMLCSLPLELENGHFVIDTQETERPAYNTEVQYKCNEGYKFSYSDSIDDIRSVRCDWSDDLWNVYLTSLPECLPLPCPLPIEIDHGSYSEPNGESFVFKDVALYTCDEGFEMTGLAEITCESSQSWSNDPPTCSPVKCPEPVAPINGRVKGKTWIYQSVISFKCDRGYNLNGTRYLTCQSDRTWSTPFPVCDPVPCGEPPEVENSNVFTTSEVFKGCAIYTCKHGFYLNGYPKLRCTAAGHWQKNLPTCNFMLCPKPPVTSHVVFADSVLSTLFSDRSSGNYIYDDVVTYSCKEGYETHDKNDLSAVCLTGENIPNIPTCDGHIGYVTDVIDGYWSRWPPVCTAKDCGPPPSPHKNGLMFGTETTFNHTVHYRCKNGYYTLDWDTTATCLAHGGWSRLLSPSCLPVSCGEPGTPKHGYYNGTIYTYQEIVEYGCDVGYDLVGTQTLRCQATAGWDGTPPICEPVDCGRLPLIKHGELEFEDTILGEEAIYSCVLGYYMEGNPVIECMSSGKWSHPQPPICLPVDCGKLVAPMNGSLKATGHVFKHTANYSCSPGYDLVGESSIECLSNASWSSMPPSCQPVDCGVLGIVENSEIISDELGTTFLSRRKYECNIGYEMKGKDVVLCMSSATWSELPACTRVKCPSPRRPEFGQISVGISTEYRYQDMIEYSCNQGYIPSGGTTTRCTAERSWMEPPPVCHPVDCGGPPDVEHGLKSGRKSTFMSVITYSCLPGYYLLGNSSLECLHTGEWNVLPPTCHKVSCGKPPHLRHGTISGSETPDDWTFESHILFACKTGYHLHGGSGAECSEDGEWIYDFNYYDEDASSYGEKVQVPTCEIIRCPDPPVIEHGSYKTKNYTYGHQVIYECDEGYEKVETEVVLCTGNDSTSLGIYIGEAPSCNPVSCGNPKEIDHGHVSYDEITYESIADYSCNDGYNTIGNTAAMCMANKRWSSFPKCEPKNCGTPTLPVNSNITVTSTLFPTTLEAKCEDGYELLGEDRMRCTSAGIWSNENMFACAPVSCGEPDSLDNGVKTVQGTLFKNTVVYECLPGYNLISRGVDSVGNAVTLRCQSDATWKAGLPLCDPVVCGVPPTIENGVSDPNNSVSFPERVQYECNEGYSFGWFAHTEIECTAEGTFSGSAPQCFPVSCGTPRSLNNAIVAADAYTFQNIATYTCLYGYVMSDDDYGLAEIFRSQCTSSGVWKPLPPHEGCVPYQCGPPLILQNAETPPYTENTYFGDLFTYTCVEGHETAENSTTVTCKRYGEWSTGPDCQPVDCGLRECPDNGFCENTGTIFQRTFTARCDTGYEFEPNIREFTVECLADASWSMPENTDTFEECTRMSCGPHPTIKHGRGISDLLLPEAQLYGSRIQYVCDPGYELHGTKDSVVCNGTWSPDPPECLPKDCGDPPSCIEKANCTFETTTFKSSFTVSCNEGYELEQDIPVKDLKCGESGEWERPEEQNFACLPLECAALPAIKHGHPLRDIARNNPTYQEKIGYECDVGYYVEGIFEVACQSDRTYTEVPQCLPVSCGNPVELVNGVIDSTGNTYEHEATYQCDPGYYMEGARQWICESNGEWKTKVSVKEHIAPLGRMAAPSDYSTRQLQAMLSEASGMNRENVDSQTNVDRNTKMEPIVDSASRSKRNVEIVFAEEHGSGSNILEKTLPRAVVAFAEPIYTLDRTPSCHPVSCGFPPDVSHSSQTQSDVVMVYKDFITYKCEPGFELRGDATLHCQATGTFGPNPPPSCVRVQCPIPEVKKHCEMIGPEIFKYEGSLIYRPLKGYEFSASSETEFISISCMENGRSDIIDLPNCAPVSCGIPPTPLNGRFNATGLTYQQTATYSCEAGYELDGLGVIKCLSTREWSPRAPGCRPVSCGQPPSLHLGSMKTSSGNFDPYSYGQSVKYECDEGYRFDSVEDQGIFTINCEHNRRWDTSPPECVPVPCPELPVFMHGQFNISGESVFGAKSYFQCDIGHEMEGESLLLCEASGSWSSSPPICSPVSCDLPPRVLHSGQEFTTTPLIYGQSITYECLPGYELEGASTLTCQEDQTFDYPTPTCTPVECLPPLDLEFGRYMKNAGGFFYKSSITYRCDIGYKMTSEEDEKQFKTVTCEWDKSWTSGPPTCEIISCEDPGTLENGYADFVATTFGSLVAFSCELGYEIQGNSTKLGYCLDTHICRVCQANGLWGTGNSKIQQELPICIPVSCGEPPALDNARSETDNYVYRGVTNYTCNEGFEITAIEGLPCSMISLNCWSNAQWGPLPLPECERVICPPPVEIANGNARIVYKKSADSEELVFEDIITYECEHGYIVTAQENVTCGANKLWDTDVPSCRPVDCGQPPTRKHGYLVDSENIETTFNNIVVYACDNGYEYDGSETDNTLSCTADGIWSHTEPPACEPIRCVIPESIEHGSYTLNNELMIYRSEVEYQCDPGYEMSGEGVLSCQANKSWKPSIPTCNPVPCSSPPPILHGYAILETPTTSIKIPTIELPPPDMHILIEKAPTQLDPGSIEKRDLSFVKRHVFGDNVHYECETGYKIADSENDFAQCDQNGKWANMPTCTLVTCEAIPSKNHSDRVGDLMTFNETISYVCDEGYALPSGDKSFDCICGADGHFAPVSSSENSSLCRRSLPQCERISCGSAPDVENSLMGDKQDHYLFEDTISYTCLEGYLLKGSSEIQCRANGKYKPSLPICERISCSVPPPVDNAASILESGIKYTDIVKYECHPGFLHMKKDKARVCQSDGTWSNECVKCDPVNCTNVDSPEHGEIVSFQGVTFGSAVVFSCNEGFDLVGKEVISCDSTGNWTANTPVCVRRLCEQVPSIKHGIPSANLIFPRYEDEVQFKCIEGYEIRGNPVITCQANGTWTSVPRCRTIKCWGIPTVPNSLFENENNDVLRYGQLVFYACNPGYQLGTDMNTKACQADGTFSSEIIICERIPCPPVPEIAHGVSSMLNASYGDNVTYTCNEGHRIVGVDIIRCGILGTWIDPSPTCEPISCGAAPVVKNAMAVSETEEYVFDEDVVYECIKGYEMNGLQTKHCLSDGTFDDTDVQCLPVRCEEIISITHGIFNAEEITFLSEGILTCEPGFELSSSNDEEQFICQANRKWSKDITEYNCLPVECSELNVFSNGEVEFTHSPYSSHEDHIHVYGAIAQFSCLEGYTLEGSSTVSCDTNGRWSHTQPTCVPVSCGEAPVVENSVPLDSVFTFEMVAEYQCIDDYILATGAKSRLCQADGTFSTEEIVCEKIQCPSVPNTDHGTPLLEKSFVGDMNFYICEPGYESHSSFICLSSGQWDSELNPCLPVDCDFPPVFETASLVEDSEFVYGTFAHYICNTGYVLLDGTNQFKLVCTENGSFAQPEYLCAPVRCNLDMEIENGRLFHPDGFTTFGDAALMICDEGYTSTGSEDVLCTENGEWEFVGAGCQIKDCGTAPNITHATPVLDANYIYKYQGTVKYICDEGYMLIDPETVITCQSNGMFADADMELCTPSSCVVDTDIKHGSISSHSVLFGEKLTITCDTGYEIEELQSDQAVVTCEAEGFWSRDISALVCHPLTCERLEMLENGVILLDDAIQKNSFEDDGLLLYNSTIRYKCSRGYTLKGISKQQCLPDGTWTGSLPLCDPVECGSPPFILHGTILGGNKSSYGNEITYECDVGYKLEPERSSRRVCNEMGSWTGRHPLCTIVTCGPPLSVENADVESYAYTYESEIGIVCNVGHVMTVGEEMRICQSDGSWSGMEPVCERINCGIHPQVEHGFVEPNNASHYQDEVVITCEDGYELFGDAVRVCESEGEWEGINPECFLFEKKRFDIPEIARFSILKCEPPVMNSTKVKVIEGTELKELYNEGEKIEYCCVAGYIPTSSMIMECKDGAWIGQPSCIHQCRHKCRNRGRCSGRDRCTCSHGWTGSRCHKPVCTLPCLNGGFCSGPSLCSCKHGWTGSRCQTAICSKPCQNGGRCIGPNTCYCPYGFSGGDCSQTPFFSLW
ncbi:sushi, von Willebrand factor type A, EGF and pentraxin domain-containing protein 1-like isoform X2 [Styela clava]